MYKLVFSVVVLISSLNNLFAINILIEMNDKQNNHLKAYGVAYSAVESGKKVEWLLNHEGGSFMFNYTEEIEKECKLKGVCAFATLVCSATASTSNIPGGAIVGDL